MKYQLVWMKVYLYSVMCWIRHYDLTAAQWYVVHLKKQKATNQCSGPGVNGSILCPLLLPLLLQSFLPLAVLVPGEDPCHAHSGTREVELVTQFDQGVVLPQNLHHLHFYLLEVQTGLLSKWCVLRWV